MRTQAARRRRLRRSTRPALAATTLLAMVAALAPAQAQPADSRVEGLGEVIDVELVNVDVWVTDSRGEPVEGLDGADFEVRHDGRPVEITHFREIRGGRSVGGGGGGDDDGGAPATAGVADEAAPGAGDAPSPSPAHVVVYFDQTRLRPTNYQPLVAALRRLLDSAAVAPERVLVLRQQQALVVEQPFGSSRQELEAALDRLASSPPMGFDLDAESRLAVDAILDSWERSRSALGSALTGTAGIPSSTPGDTADSGSPRDVVGGGFGIDTGPDACGSFVSQVQPILGSWARSRSQAVNVTLSNLSDAASFLAGIPGVKMLLYLSDGLETEPGTDLATYAAGLCPAGSSELLTSLRGESMSQRFLQLTHHANTNRVTIHALQASGLKGSQAGDASGRRQASGGGAPRAVRAFESSRRGVERDGLGLLADETGGRAIYNRNEFDDELLRIGHDAANYYSLAYAPPDGGAKGRREHQIEVEVKTRGANARYRRGYVEKDARQWLGERVEGALNLGITDNRLGVRLAAAGARPIAEGELRLPLHVIIPAERLAFLPSGDDHVAQVSIKVMARGVTSNTLTIWDREFRIKGAPGASGWADLTIDLDLPAGTYFTGVGVRDEATREASFLSTTLDTGAGG